MPIRRDSHGRFAGGATGTSGRLSPRTKKYAKRAALVAGLGAASYAGAYAHHITVNRDMYGLRYKTAGAKGVLKSAKRNMRSRRMGYAFQKAGYRQKPFVQGYAQYRTRKMGSFVHGQIAHPLSGKVTLRSSIRYHQQNVMPRGAERRIYRGITGGIPRSTANKMKPQLTARIRQEYGASTRLMAQQRAQHRRLVMRYPIRSYNQRNR